MSARERVVVLSLAAAVLAVNLAACGEKPTATVYKQGTYSGKVDNQAWDNDQFKGDKTAWEKAIHARNAGQNEYVRIGQ